MGQELTPKWRRLVRYDLPLHFILLLTNWLPDNVPFLALHGRLARHFFAQAGENLEIGRNVSFYNPARIYLGKDVYIAHGCRFIAGADIKIGDEALFGPYCVIAASNHRRQARSFRHGDAEFMPVEIARGCWLGAHAVVTAGSVIGEGALVAAGAVIVGDIPPDVAAGGVPARILKELVP